MGCEESRVIVLRLGRLRLTPFSESMEMMFCTEKDRCEKVDRISYRRNWVAASLNRVGREWGSTYLYVLMDCVQPVNSPDLNLF